MSLRCPDGRQINSTNERQWEVFDVGSAVVSLLFMGARQGRSGHDGAENTGAGAAPKGCVCWGRRSPHRKIIRSGN